jgi:hypothetical protein
VIARVRRALPYPRFHEFAAADEHSPQVANCPEAPLDRDVAEKSEQDFGRHD